MTFLVLFILAVVWAVYLFSWVKTRSETRSVNSISSFNKHLTVLERTSPARTAISTGTISRPVQVGRVPLPVNSAPQTLKSARQRRRDVLFGLGGASLITLFLAVVAGGPFIVLFLLAAGATGAYVTLLVRAQRSAIERRTKVVYLPTETTHYADYDYDYDYDSGYALQPSASLR